MYYLFALGFQFRFRFLFISSFDISDSLLKRESLEILDSNGDNINVDRSPDPADNLTAISWRCTISPLMSASDVLSPEDQILCSTAGRRHPFFSRGSGFESGGAIVLAVVSSVILLAAVSVLAVMHRMGKLDQYL